MTAIPDLHKFALVATLYSDPATLRQFADDLADSNDWPPHERNEDAWNSPDQTLWAVLITNRSAPDSAALQLTCNVPTTGWATARARLEALLSPDRLADNIGGYTLLYWAEYTAVCTTPNPTPPDILADAVPLHHAGDRAYPLHRDAATVREDGWLWLTHLPIHNEGAEAALVYVVIVQHEREDALAHQLLGLTAPFLMLDLVAHKGYVWQRRYRLNPALQQTDMILSQLGDVTSTLLEHDTLQRANTDLQPMTAQYNQVVGLLPQLDDIRYNLDKQRINLKQWAAHLPLDPLTAFHQNHFDITILQLDLLLKRGRDKLDVASTTVNIVQARLDEAQLARENRQNMLLAFIGTALAVPGVFDRTSAAMLLACFDPAVNACLWLTESAMEETRYTIFTLMGVQLGVVFLLMMVMWGVLGLIRRSVSVS